MINGPLTGGRGRGKPVAFDIRREEEEEENWSLLISDGVGSPGLCHVMSCDVMSYPGPGTASF